MTLIFILTLPFLFIFKNIDGANILAALPSGAYSHFRPFEPFLLKLRERGHNLTVISAFPIKEKLQNYTVITPDAKPVTSEYKRIFNKKFCCTLDKKIG